MTEKSRIFASNFKPKKEMKNIFKIKKEKRWEALITLLVIIAFNVLMQSYQYDKFNKIGNSSQHLSLPH